MVIGPSPAGNGRDRPCDPLSLGKGDVADQLGFPVRPRNPVDADVDDNGAVLDPGSADKFGPPYGGYQNISTLQAPECPGFWNERA